MGPAGDCEHVEQVLDSSVMRSGRGFTVSHKLSARLSRLLNAVA